MSHINSFIYNAHKTTSIQNWWMKIILASNHCSELYGHCMTNIRNDSIYAEHHRTYKVKWKYPFPNDKAYNEHIKILSRLPGRAFIVRASMAYVVRLAQINRTAFGTSMERENVFARSQYTQQRFRGFFFFIFSIYYNFNVGWPILVKNNSFAYQYSNGRGGFVFWNIV